MARWSPTRDLTGNPGATGEGIAEALYRFGDTVGEVQDARRASAQEKVRRAEAEKDAQRRDRELLLREADDARRAREHQLALAQRGVYDELDEAQQIEDIDTFDRETGKWAGLTKRYQPLGGGIQGFRDITKDPDYVAGRTAYDQRQQRDLLVNQAIKAGVPRGEAEALAAAGGNALADTLEERAKLPTQLKRERATYLERDKLAAASEERRLARERELLQLRQRGGGGTGGGGGGGVPRNLKDAEAVVSRQIDDTRAELGVADALDPDTGQPAQPERLKGLQARLDSLNGVRDRLAQEMVTGQPPGDPREAANAEIARQIPVLQQKRAKAVEALKARGMTQAEAERRANQAYAESARQLNLRYAR